MVDAIARVTYREAGFRKASARVGDGRASRERQHSRPGCLLAFDVPRYHICGGLTILIILIRPDALAPAFPFLAVWAMSPLLAYFVSCPSRPAGSRALSWISKSDELAFGCSAHMALLRNLRGNDDNWLPPDNFQEEPRLTICEPHIADERGSAAAIHCRRARFRLPRFAGDRRAS
jgi:hypothetical protein